MSVDFASLPALWAAICDAVSGRETAINAMAHETYDWPSNVDAEAAVDGSEVVVTLDTPEGQRELRSPLPLQTFAGLQTVCQDPDWHRAVTVSGTGYIVGPWFWSPYVVREYILDAVWPLEYDTKVGGIEWSFGAGPEVDIYLSAERHTVWKAKPWQVDGEGGGEPPGIYGSTTGEWEMLTFMSAEWAGRLQDWPSHSQGPLWLQPPQEWLQAALQRPGAASVVLSGDEILALDKLADAFASISSDGRVQTSRGRTVLSYHHSPVTLPEVEADATKTLQRLAIALENFFTAELSVGLRKPSAVASLTRGVISDRL